MTENKDCFPREVMMELCLGRTGTGCFLGGHWERVPSFVPYRKMSGPCRAMPAQSLAVEAAHLDLNVLGVDHFHNAHHIIEHQAELLAVI